MVKIKLVYNKEIRELSLNQPDNLLNQLLEKVREVTRVKYSIPKLLYEDLENDTIVILSNSDLDHCIKVFAQRGDIPEIRILYPLMGKPSQLAENVLVLSQNLTKIFRFTQLQKTFCISLCLFTLLLGWLYLEKGQSGDDNDKNLHYSADGSYLNNTLDSSNSNNSLLIFLPSTAVGDSPRDTCKQSIIVENYSDLCIKSLEEKVPHFNQPRKKIIENAWKPPNEEADYLPITGFLNMVIDADKYTSGPHERGDPISDIQLETIRKSGLLKHAALRVRVGILRSSMTEEERIDKAKWIVEDAVERLTCGAKHPVTIEYWDPSGDPLKDECATINLIRHWCTASHRQKSFIFYLHNKGKTRESNIANWVNIRDWRNYLMYFLFERWELCANTLSQGIPTCGVDLRVDETGMWPHYSGNYWWARCDRLSNINRVCTNNPRFWLLHEHQGKISPDEYRIGRSLWDNDMDHFHMPFPRSKYNCVDLIRRKEKK